VVNCQNFKKGELEGKSKIFAVDKLAKIEEMVNKVLNFFANS